MFNAIEIQTCISFYSPALSLQQQKRIIMFIEKKKTFMALSNNKNWMPTTIAKKIDNNKNIVINGWNTEKNAVFQFE